MSSCFRHRFTLSFLPRNFLPLIISLHFLLFLFFLPFISNIYYCFSIYTQILESVKRWKARPSAVLFFFTALGWEGDFCRIWLECDSPFTNCCIVVCRLGYVTNRCAHSDSSSNFITLDCFNFNFLHHTIFSFSFMFQYTLSSMGSLKTKVLGYTYVNACYPMILLMICCTI